VQLKQAEISQCLATCRVILVHASHGGFHVVLAEDVRAHTLGLLNCTLRVNHIVISHDVEVGWDIASCYELIVLVFRDTAVETGLSVAFVFVTLALLHSQVEDHVWVGAGRALPHRVFRVGADFARHALDLRLVAAVFVDAGRVQTLVGAPAHPVARRARAGQALQRVLSGVGAARTLYTLKFEIEPG